VRDPVDVDDLPDGLVVADQDGRVIRANDRAVSMLLGDPDTVIGAPLDEVIALDDLDGHTWYDCLRPYDGLRTRTRLVERSWYRPDGHELLVTGRIVRASPSAPVARVSVGIRNVRDRERLDRDRSDLVATVAHELRSPLTGVKGFTATLLAKWDRFTDEQKRTMLTAINADADRVTRLLSDLLDVSRIDAGRLVLRKRVVDLATLVGRLVTALAENADRPFALQLDRPLPELWLDPDKIQQIVGNLVDNALRHGDGTVRLELTQAEVDGAPGAQLTVSDEGEGIGSEGRARIFARFWQAGNAKTGTGLGLYIVKGLVEAHGGTIELADNPGGGARFVVRLPAGKAPYEE